MPRVCPKGMAAALLQALLAVAGAPSPSRNGRATIARRRSVSGIRRPARVLHSRARHGTGGLRRGHARGHVRTSSATSSGRTSPPPYARSSSAPATSTHKVFPASLLFPSLPANSIGNVECIVYLPRKNIASDEFISLDAPCEADAKDEGGERCER